MPQDPILEALRRKRAASPIQPAQPRVTTPLGIDNPILKQISTQASAGARAEASIKPQPVEPLPGFGEGGVAQRATAGFRDVPSLYDIEDFIKGPMWKPETYAKARDIDVGMMPNIAGPEKTVIGQALGLTGPMTAQSLMHPKPSIVAELLRTGGEAMPGVAKDLYSIVPPGVSPRMTALGGAARAAGGIGGAARAAGNVIPMMLAGAEQGFGSTYEALADLPPGESVISQRGTQLHEQIMDEYRRKPPVPPADLSTGMSTEEGVTQTPVPEDPYGPSYKHGAERRAQRGEEILMNVAHGIGSFATAPTIPIRLLGRAYYDAKQAGAMMADPKATAAVIAAKIAKLPADAQKGLWPMLRGALAGAPGHRTVEEVAELVKAFIPSAGDVLGTGEAAAPERQPNESEGQFQNRMEVWQNDRVAQVAANAALTAGVLGGIAAHPVAESIKRNIKEPLGQDATEAPPPKGYTPEQGKAAVDEVNAQLAQMRGEPAAEKAAPPEPAEQAAASEPNVPTERSLADVEDVARPYVGEERRGERRFPGMLGMEAAVVLRRPDGEISVGDWSDARFNEARGGKTLNVFDEGADFDANLGKANQAAQDAIRSKTPARPVVPEETPTADRLAKLGPSKTLDTLREEGFHPGAVARLGVEGARKIANEYFSAPTATAREVIKSRVNGRGPSSAGSGIGSLLPQLDKAGFYDPLMEALRAGKKLVKASASDWTKYLYRFPGTQEQAKWIGLDDFLAGRIDAEGEPIPEGTPPKTSFTKEEIDAYIRRNNFEVEEKWLKGDAKAAVDEDYQSRVDSLQEQIDDLRHGNLDTREIRRDIDPDFGDDFEDNANQEVDEALSRIQSDARREYESAQSDAEQAREELNAERARAIEEGRDADTDDLEDAVSDADAEVERRRERLETAEEGDWDAIGSEFGEDMNEVYGDSMSQQESEGIDSLLERLRDDMHELEAEGPGEGRPSPEGFEEAPWHEYTEHEPAEGKTRVPDEDRYYSVVFTLPGGTRERKTLSTDTRHYKYPNQLFHVRFTEREVDGKKVMFIEEVQSDQGQQGRDYGWRDEKFPARVEAVKARQRELRVEHDLVVGERNDLRNERDTALTAARDRAAQKRGFESFEKQDEEAYNLRHHDDVYGPDGPARDEAVRKFKDANRERDAARDEAESDPAVLAVDPKLEEVGQRISKIDNRRNKVDEERAKVEQAAYPTPWITDTQRWTKRALSRMLHYAAQNDFDAIAWTTGEQQTARWSGVLRAHVDTVKWEKVEKGIQITAMKGGKVLPELHGLEKPLGPVSLEQALGKDMAKQIIDNPEQSGAITGENIKVDSPGMKQYYDEIMPSVLRKIASKWGGTVEPREMEFGKTNSKGVWVGPELSSKEIADAYEHWLNTNFPDRVAGGDRSSWENQQIDQAHDASWKLMEAVDAGKTLPQAFTDMIPWMSWETIEALSQEFGLKKEHPNERHMVPWIDINAQMKGSAEQGGVARGFSSWSGADPKLIQQALQHGAALLKKAPEFGEWASRMLREVGPSIGPHLKKIYEQAKSMPLRAKPVEKERPEAAAASGVGSFFGKKQPAAAPPPAMTPEEAAGQKKLGELWERSRDFKPGQAPDPYAGRTPYSVLRGMHRYNVGEFPPLRHFEKAWHRLQGTAVPRFGLDKRFELVPGDAAKADATLGRLLEEVLDPLAKVPQESLFKYMAAKRIEDRIGPHNTPEEAERKKVAGWTEKTAAGAIAALKKTDPHWGLMEKILSKGGPYQTLMKEMLDLQVESGRMSPEIRKAIEASGDFYAPFRVLSAMNDIEADAKAGTGRVIPGTQQLTKAITGIHDIDFSLQKDFFKTSAEQIVRAHRLAGKNSKMLILDEMARQQPTDHVRLLGPEEQPRQGYDVSTYLKDGQPQRLEVAPYVARALKGLSPGETDASVDFLRKMSVPFRAGTTTWNAAFQITNALGSDIPRVAIMSRAGIQHPLDVLRFGLDAADAFFFQSLPTNVLGKPTELFKRMMQEGALNSTVSRWVQEETGYKRKLATRQGTKGQRAWWKTLDTVNSISNAVEETGKALAWKRLERFNAKKLSRMAPKERALAMEEMASEVRNYGGSPDFLRHGEARTLNLLFMFYNASLQGIERDLARLSGKTGAKDAGMVWARLAPAVAAFSYYSMMQRDPKYKSDYDALAPWERDNYFHIWRDKWFTTNDGQKVRESYRIPKKATIKLIANMIDDAAEFINSKDPHALAQLGAHVFENISPINVEGENTAQRIESVLGSMNPAIKGAAEYATGRSFFRHEETEPPQLQSKPPEERFTEQTPEIYKKLGRATGASPLKLEQLAGTMTGNAFNQLTPRAPVEGRSAWTERAPFKRFVRSTGVNYDDLYSEWTPVEQVYNQWHSLVGKGDNGAAAAAYRAEHAQDIAIYYRLKGLVERLGNHRALYRKVKGRGKTMEDETTPQFRPQIEEALAAVDAIRSGAPAGAPAAPPPQAPQKAPPGDSLLDALRRKKAAGQR